MSPDWETSELAQRWKCLGRCAGVVERRIFPYMQPGTCSNQYWQSRRDHLRSQKPEQSPAHFHSPLRARPQLLVEICAGLNCLAHFQQTSFCEHFVTFSTFKCMAN